MYLEKRGLKNFFETILMKRLFRLAFLSLLITPVSQVVAEEVKQPPNVIVILTDDQGWGDLSHSGNKNLSTPRIDGLARAGASFDRFYVCPVCSPTRAEFLTGRYHPRSNVFSTSAGGERIDLDEMTIAETFRAAGYATSAYGKWHNGMQAPYHPNARGFDDYYGFCSGHWGHYHSPQLEHNGQLVKGDGFVIDDFTNHAMNFIEENREKPFFVYLPFNTPHSPMQVPDRWWEKFKDREITMHNREPNKENLPHLRAALAMCENIDWNVGRLLDKLDDLKLADNTIVVYFCDNGPNGVRWNGDMKGRKGSTDEGGVRSPCFIRWPAKIAAGQNIETIAGAIDLLPTLAGMTGVKVASKKPLDGINLAPVLTGGDGKSPDRYIFSHWKGKVSVRSQRFRLDNGNKLYDMINDGGQRTDVTAKHPESAEKLQKAAAHFRATVVKELRTESRPFTLGHPDFVMTQIPARDGIAHGEVKRSNRFPNCSFFTNWKSVDDKITWDIEVLTSGDYNVELHYTANKPGAVLELSLGNAKLSKVISTAHTSPLIGAEEDRSPRSESLVKNFRPLKMGVISLEKGRSELTLKASKMPVDGDIEFRLLMFERVEE